MSIGYIDSTGNTKQTTSTSTVEDTDNSSFTQSDFITLLVEELQNQDPTTPTSTSELMTELTQMQNISASQEQTDSMQAMTDSLETMNDSFETLSENMENMVSEISDTMSDLTDNMDDMISDMNTMFDDMTETMDTMSSLMDTNNSLMYAMVYDNTFQNACNLTGSYVTGTDTDGNSLEGTVTAAFMKDNVIYLTLDDGSAMPYSKLTGVAEEAPTSTSAASGTTGTETTATA